MKRYMFESLEVVQGVSIIDLHNIEARDDYDAIFKTVSFSMTYGTEVTGLYRLNDNSIVAVSDFDNTFECTGDPS